MLYALAAYLEPEEPVGVVSRRRVSARPVAPKVKISRLVQLRSGRAMDIPVGAKVYSLDGRLVAHRKIGDASAPVIRRNGVFIMRVDSSK